MCKYNRGLVWIRRDYRLIDHHALFKAKNECEEIFVCFIFDSNILDNLRKNDQRIAFIIQALREIDNELRQHHGKLIIRYGKPSEKIKEIITAFNINALFFNRDYEPYAKQRDENIKQCINIPIYTFKDSVVFEKGEITTKTNQYYKVFTPYKNEWLKQLTAPLIKDYTSDQHNYGSVTEESSIHDDRWFRLLGFNRTTCTLPGGRSHGLKLLNCFKSSIHTYDEDRDYPHLNQTSNLSPYIRFGCISIREMVRFAMQFKSSGSAIWLSELIWRDFYQMITDTHPNCDKASIKPEYDKIKWLGNDDLFNAWCSGQTGVPIIDAAMRQLNTTGLMHNRCRMIVASFLCKTLLVNWRKGEAYFAEKLLDFDFASNNGGWGGPHHQVVMHNPISEFLIRICNLKNLIQMEITFQYCQELKHLNNKEIHNPPNVNGYPSPVVDYKINRQKPWICMPSLKHKYSGKLKP